MNNNLTDKDKARIKDIIKLLKASAILMPNQIDDRDSTMLEINIVYIESQVLKLKAILNIAGR